jgi:predicted DCC family thiol-disulfide oxidoreductase YuxK
MDLEENKKIQNYILLSKGNINIILYDGSCSLCKNASRLAYKLLRSNKHKSITQSIQTTLKREIMNEDEFMLIHNGEIYKSHVAWAIIFSMSNGPVKYLGFMSKFKIILYVFEKIYKIISKYRKFIYKRKGDCNC